MNPNDPAFFRIHASERPGEYVGGLTKREYFAAMAMQGILKNSAWAQAVAASFPDPRTGAEVNAITAVINADALIAELSKEQK